MYGACMYTRKAFTVFTSRRRVFTKVFTKVFTEGSLLLAKSRKNPKKGAKMRNKNRRTNPFIGFLLLEITKMYAEVVKSWNPWVGCNHNCRYCDPSFKRQAKRQKKRCKLCYGFVPHFHPERLKNQSFPKHGLIFVCDMGDIAFATKDQIILILDVIRNHPQSTFLLQSKNPSCFYGLNIPDNAIVGTTLESNRFHPEITNAPAPGNRAYWLSRIICKHKAVTIEPIMQFDHEVFVGMIRDIHPDWVWVGYNNYPKSVSLEEPSKERTLALIESLKSFTEIKLKTIREKL